MLLKEDQAMAKDNMHKIFCKFRPHNFWVTYAERQKNRHAYHNIRILPGGSHQLQGGSGLLVTCLKSRARTDPVQYTVFSIGCRPLLHSIDWLSPSPFVGQKNEYQILGWVIIIINGDADFSILPMKLQPTRWLGMRVSSIGSGAQSSVLLHFQTGGQILIESNSALFLACPWYEVNIYRKFLI